MNQTHRNATTAPKVLRPVKKRSNTVSVKVGKDALILDGILARQHGSRVAKYVDIHGFAPAKLVEWIRKGVPASAFRTVAVDLGMDQERLIKSLGVGRSTLKRKVAKKQRLSSPDSERVLGVTQLVAEAQRVVEESGEREGFDAAAWVGEWIQTPVPALGNRRPEEYLDTAMGQLQVLQILRQMQSGTYA